MQQNNVNSILTLFSILDNIRGRTKLQKIIFILQQLGYNFEEDYKYHYYGPYSADLQIEVDYLVSQGYLSEQQNNSTFLYSIRKKPLNYKENKKLRDSSSLITDLNSEQSQFLEVLSTIFYLHEYDTTDATEIRKKLLFLKPHLEQYFDGAFDKYNSLVA